MAVGSLDRSNQSRDDHVDEVVGILACGTFNDVFEAIHWCSGAHVGWSVRQAVGRLEGSTCEMANPSWTGSILIDNDERTFDLSLKRIMN